MMSRKIWFSVTFAGVLAAGCDDPPVQEGPVGLDAGTKLDGQAEDSDASQPKTGPSYAVVSSDWKATSISVLDEKGDLLADNYVNSGSTTAGLVTALSGDVEMPKRSGEPGIMVLIDRFKTDVITRIRLSDGKILGQIKTHTPATETTGTAYSSNPWDYIYVDAQTAWVTRNQPNLDTAAPEIDRGDDLFRINPTTMERAGERIDLASLDVKVTRTDATTGATEEVTAFARPGRVVRLGQTVVVGIGRTAYDFKAVGPGAIALVDLATEKVTGFELEGLKGCAQVNAIPNDADSVVVTCAGDFNANERDTAGIVILDIVRGAASVGHVWRAKDDPSATPFTSSTVSLGGTLVGAAANDYAGGPDIFAIVDIATGKRTDLLTFMPGSGRFGTPAFDAASGLLLLPDAAVDANKTPTAGVRRFQRNADGSLSERATIRAASTTGMPARHVYPL